MTYNKAVYRAGDTDFQIILTKTGGRGTKRYVWELPIKTALKDEL